jgi:PKD repeat protein
VGALVLMLMLIIGVGNSHAADLTWTNNGSDFWQSTTAWDGAPAFPGSGDDAFFTNAATYTVTLNSDVLNIQSNFFNNALNTTATVTLNLNTHELNPAYSGTSPGAFVVADPAGCTTIVYLASSTVTGKGLVVPGRIIVGRNGFGTLVVTNGAVSVATTLLANGSGGCGTLVLSGPSVVWSNSTDLAIGNNSNSFGSALVISNSALMEVSSTFRVGSGSSSGGSSNNTLLLDTGGKLFTQSGPVTIGNNGTSTAPSPSYNNSATVQGGAIWDNGNATFIVGYAAGGGAATGNVLTVGVGGVVTNISHLTITPSNTLNMGGGIVNALTECDGTVQGFGTVRNDVTVTGFLIPFNSLGTLAFSNKLTLTSAATTTVQLGTNSNAMVVRGILTLGGTLNITDGGGFAAGTYTLFTYKSTLTSSGLTIGTTPNGGFTCTIDTNTAGVVKLNVTGGPPSSPVAAFTGNPTSGVAGSVVTFTDSSTGTITNRFWDFGDGATTNTLATSLSHAYSNVGSYDVSLTVFGPVGTNTLSRLSYITIGNAPPVITAGATVSNAALQVGNVIVVVAGDTNTFNVGATDPEGNPLNYQWSFGDGVTNAWSPSNTVDHAYTTNCGPYAASVTISNGLATIASNFTIVVACQLNLARLAPKLSFARTNSDSCTITGAFDLPANTSFAGKLATLDIGGGSLTFTLPSKGSALNGRSKFSTPTFNKKTGLWKLNVSFKNGFWQTEWANYGMIDSTILKPGVLVSDLPVILLLDSEAFMATTNLHYTATQGKSGTAK